MRTLWSRFVAMFRKQRLDRELDAEMRSHLEMQAEEYMRAGMTAKEAAAAARRGFGGFEQAKEACRDRRGLPAVEGLLQDLRYAARLLRRDRGFTAVAALTLALGIGATTAVFSVVNAVVLRPLPYPESSRLMAILSSSVDDPARTFLSAPGVYLDWRDRATSFESMAGVRQTVMILTDVGETREIRVAQTGAGYFEVMGLRPALGRAFTGEEDRPGHSSVALLDHGFWRTVLGGTEGVLGRSIVLDDREYTIIGVLPPDPPSPHSGQLKRAEVWLPIAASREARAGGDVLVIGRLRQGTTRAAAQQEMDAVMAGIRGERQEDRGTAVAVRPLQDWVAGEVRRPFLLLLGAVVLVLAICCANVAGLMMARAAARQKEMAIRAGLGAGSRRLMRQALVESLLLSALGGVLGLPLAVAAVRAVPAIRAFQVPRSAEIAVDWAMLSFTAVVTLATGVVFGLAPAIQAARTDVSDALKQGGASRFRLAGGHRFRNALVAAQLALALVLLAGAGLLANSFLRLVTVDPGFDRSRVLTAGTRLPFKKYDRRRAAEFHRRLRDEVRRLPGIAEASSADSLPLTDVRFPVPARALDSGRRCEAQARHVAPRYFRVMRIPMLAGRDFEPADDTRTPVPALVNQTMARALFGAVNPLGRRLTTTYRDRKEIEVIGVVGDARQLALARKPGSQVYFPLAFGYGRYLVARGAAGSHPAASIRAAVRALDPEVPAPEIGSLELAFSEQIARPRFYLGVLGHFAAAGIGLAALGMYGLVSYTIARRTPEIGLRMALGAGRPDILRLVLGLGLRLALVGAVLGTAGALAATRVLSTLLYEVRPGDPMTFAAVLALLAAVVLAACWLPARRAAGVDPSVALRCE
jgi:putative ABC transport system permease protein